MITILIVAASLVPQTAPVAGGYLGWREHRIDDSELAGLALRGADGLAIADLDADGHPDVVSVHEDSAHVRIAFGTDSPDEWTSLTLAGGEAVGGCEDVAVGDVDGDGRPDVVVAAESGNVTIFRAPAEPRNMVAWKAEPIGATLDRGSWIRVALADVDGDTDLDIVATNKAAPERLGGYSWFERASSAGDSESAALSWREHTIGRSVFPINAQPADMDGDGDLDIVAGSWGEESLFLFRNAGRGRSWLKRLIHTGREPLAFGFMLQIHDLDADGRPDVIASSGPRWSGRDAIYWFAQPADLSSAWQPHLIGSIHPDKSTGLLLIELSGDELPDLLVGGYSWEPWDHEPEDPAMEDPSGRLAWFEAPADVRDPWRRHDISRRRRGMFDVFIPADLSGDGLTDIVTTRGNSGEYDGVLWLERLLRDEPGPSFERARAQDSPELAPP